MCVPYFCAGHVQALSKFNQNTWNYFRQNFCNITNNNKNHNLNWFRKHLITYSEISVNRTTLSCLQKYWFLLVINMYIKALRMCTLLLELYCIGTWKSLFPLLSILLSDQSFPFSGNWWGKCQINWFVCHSPMIQYSQCTLDVHITEEWPIE